MPNLADLIDPMPGKVAVQVKTRPEITTSGLFIPRDTVRSVHDQKATQGTVLAIGDEGEGDLLYIECTNCHKRFFDQDKADLHVKEYDSLSMAQQLALLREVTNRGFDVGDTVIFGKYSGTEINYKPKKDDSEPEKILIMNFKDILCRIKKVDEAENIKVKG